jgi:hypothetical protein
VKREKVGGKKEAKAFSMITVEKGKWALLSDIQPRQGLP